MHRHRLVIFLAEPCHILEFVDAGIDSRLIHKAQRQTACTLLQGILHDTKHPLALVIIQRSVLISGHTCPRSTMACKNCYITWSVAIDSIKEFRHRRIHTGSFMKREKSATDLIDVTGMRLETYSRQSAVAGDERCDSLADERLEIFLRSLLDRKPIIMGMSIHESGRNRKAIQIDNIPTFFRLYRIFYPYDLIIFNKDIAFERSCTGSIIDK